MGPPNDIKPIGKDGNCLCRAISYAVSNRQEYRMQVRTAVVNHMRESANALKSFLCPEFKSVFGLYQYTRNRK